MSGSVQELMASARAMLQSAGVPITTTNLNAASLALAQQANAGGEVTTPQFDSIMEQPARNVRARPAVAASTPVRLSAGAGVPTNETRMQLPEATPASMQSPTEEAAERAAGQRSTAGEERAEASPASTRTDRIASSVDANVRRRGTINAAQPIAEDDPTGGMYEGNQPRQAVDVDNPAAFGMRALTVVPMVGAGMRAATAAPVAANAARVTAQTVRGNPADQAARLIREDRALRTGGTSAPAPSAAPQPPAFVPPNGGSSAPAASTPRPAMTGPVANNVPPQIPPQVVNTQRMQNNQRQAFVDQMMQLFRRGNDDGQAALTQNVRTAR